MSKQLIKQLEQMVGKTYSYGGRIHYISNVSPLEDKDKFIIKTNLGNYERTFENGIEFLTYWEEATSVVTTTAQQPENKAVAILEKENTMVDSLTALLMDNITKVQGDASYIKQAQAINNNVNSIINLTKLKLDVLKQTRAKRI